MDSDTGSYSRAAKFCLLFRLGNLIASARHKPIRPPDHDPSFTANIAVIIPTLEGSGEQLVNTLKSILRNEPRQIILSTIDENRQKAEFIATSMQNHKSKVEVTSIPRPKKSRQIAIAVKRVRTDIVILADGDVLWPPCLVPWILAPFKDPLMGGVATCQRVQAPNNPTISFQYVWWFLGALYLERRNFDCTATTYMDGGVPCLSGRTVAYRTEILQSCMEAFVNETWFDKSLNADDDNFLTRWTVTHGYKTYFQSHPNAEVLTTLEESPKFLKQCVRWSRSNWRSNLRSLFIDRAVWWTRGGIARLFSLPKPTTIAKAPFLCGAQSGSFRMMEAHFIQLSMLGRLIPQMHSFGTGAFDGPWSKYMHAQFWHRCLIVDPGNDALLNREMGFHCNWWLVLKGFRVCVIQLQLLCHEFFALGIIQSGFGCIIIDGQLGENVTGALTKQEPVLFSTQTAIDPAPVNPVLAILCQDSDKLLRMNVRSPLNPPDEGERKVIAAVASTEKISQPPSITQGQINFPHRRLPPQQARNGPPLSSKMRSVEFQRAIHMAMPLVKTSLGVVLIFKPETLNICEHTMILQYQTRMLQRRRGFLPTPTPVQITPAPATVSSTLFPDGWVPDPYVSPQLEDVLKFKTASLGVPHDPEPPETTIMIHHYDVEELPFEILTSEAARMYDVILTTEMRCLAEDANISCVGKLSENQWINLVKWHRSLIDHHYDLLICTQHPITNGEILAIPVKYNMPSRMLHQGIYALLKIMKARRPDSHDYMISFIYYAYGLLTLLIDMVPGLKNLWLECLGDLTSYMMCLEDTDSDERETWNEISSSWYHKALDENPGKGSLYHRLGNLSKPNMGGQLFCYSRSLMATKRYERSKSSVESAFNMALNSIQKQNVTPPDLPSWFVSSHAMLLRGGSIHKFIEYVNKYIALFDTEIEQRTFKFGESTICVGIPNIAAMLQYGEEDGTLTRMFIDSQKLSWEARLEHAEQYWLQLPSEPSQNTLKDGIPSDAATFSTPLEKLTYSTYLNFHTLSFVLQRARGENIFPYVHLSLAFILSLALIPESMAYVEGEIPWTKITIFLNMLSRESVSESRLESVNFPIPTETEFPQLPEDFLFRSQIWSQIVYPPDFFTNATMKDHSGGIDMPSTQSARNERCLWYGYRLASPQMDVPTSLCTSLLIAAMNDRIGDMEHSKLFEKNLGNALDRLSYEICDAGRDDSDITRLQDIYQTLEYSKSKVEDARILKECTMDKTEAVLKKLLTSNDVDVITKANESLMRLQAYRRECEKERQHVESDGSCSGEENDLAGNVPQGPKSNGSKDLQSSRI
ncbi:predicted protein [Histoplasma mississippiense (nom. inval.)]|uniref:predicted protein n=1 Tax=Ajellomyces capsulatus (strain NAm1 / WU24) TaxID=2059318 RepID=UPI000157D0E2|nr:predicted protein [Histoplasma mississippiense (nom. inval.)]EDN11061.1 predicted protein [Histoplasma mississippiense (nom. inval.)]